MLESLFNKIFKTRLQDSHFPVKFAKFLKTSISKNICKRRLLWLESLECWYKYFGRISWYKYLDINSLEEIYIAGNYCFCHNFWNRFPTISKERNYAVSYSYVFNTLTLKQIFWKTETFFKKLDHRFLVQNTKILRERIISIQNCHIRRQC